MAKWVSTKSLYIGSSKVIEVVGIGLNKIPNRIAEITPNLKFRVLLAFLI